MKNVWIVLKKELKKFLGNKRMFFSVVVLPGLLIFLLYSIMGKALEGRFDGESEKYSIAILDTCPKDFLTLIPDNFEINSVSDEQSTQMKEKIYQGELDLYLTFPENFPTSSDEIAAASKLEVGLYYNPSEATSLSAYNSFSLILASYQSFLMEQAFNKDAIFVVNPNDLYQLYDKQKADASSIAMLLPFILIIMLVSSAISVTPESIAGEKERGTLATLLVTQVKRSEIALGKIIALSIIACLSGLSSFIGTLCSMPALMGTTQVHYNVISIILLLCILITTVIVITAFLSVLSAFAKTVKEATAISSPFSILAMLCGISAMFFKDIPTNNILYFIPILNSVNSLAQILSLSVNIVNLVTTIVCNILYTVIFILILAKMFNNEKIMFSR